MKLTVLFKSTARDRACPVRMPMVQLPGVLFLSIVLLYYNANGQSISDKELRSMEGKYQDLSERISGSTRKTLLQMQQKEAALQRKAQSVDSGKAAQLFRQVQQRYTSLLTRLNSISGGGVSQAPLQKYYPAIDSVHTSMAFLQSAGSLSNLSPSSLQKVSQLFAGTGALQQKMEIAEEAQQFLGQREAQLKEQLNGIAGGGSLLSVNKQVYYYQQQLAQYRTILNSKDQLEEKALAAVQQLPAIKQFWQKNSAFSQLFPQQQKDGQPVYTGLPTRAMVQKSITARMNKAPDDPSAPGILQTKAAEAKSQLASVKDRLAGLGASAGSTLTTMPDFTPNSQHGKRLMDRIEFGFGFQANPATNVLPVALQPSLYAGYRMSDGFTVGVGIAYILGLGQGIDKIRLSNQGVSLRSYADVKIKGSFWLTGGLEYNYQQPFTSVRGLLYSPGWQASGLAGVMKKFKLGRKEGKIQLLFDMLYATETPKGQPVVFRTAYSF